MRETGSENQIEKNKIDDLVFHEATQFSILEIW